MLVLSKDAKTEWWSTSGWTVFHQLFWLKNAYWASFTAKQRSVCIKHFFNWSHMLILMLPSVLWHCWLDGRKGIRPVKT